MFVQIVPFKKLPRGAKLFDYSVPVELEKEIQIGQTVKIPFKNSFIDGVVYKFINESQFEHIKPLKEIRTDFPILNKNELAIIDWFANYYHHSLASSLTLFFPKLPKRKIKSKIEETKETELEQTFSKTSQTIYNSAQRNFLLFPYNQTQTEQFYIDLCKIAIAKKEQIVILFPHEEKLKAFSQQLEPELANHATIITAEDHTKKNAFTTDWLNIYNNETNIILGLRSAIFLPLYNAKIIIIDNAQSEDYKNWDQNPRYHTIDIAREIVKISGHKLILSSLTPRPEDYYFTQKNQSQIIKIGADTHYKKFRIIDLSQERRIGFTFITDELLEAIIESLENRKKVLLICRKKGSFSYLLCNDCGADAICPKCRLPLSITAEKKLICYHCKHTEPAWIDCPKCHSQNIKMLGFGVDQVMEELNKKIKKDFPKFDLKKLHNVTVSTGQNISPNDCVNLGLLGFVYIDSQMYLSDFNAEYSLLSLIMNISKQIINHSPGASIIIQTLFKNANAIKNINNPTEFYKEELNLRQEFQYPPFATILKLIFEHHDEHIAAKEADSLSQKIKEKFSNNLLISGPTKHYRQMVRTRYRYHLDIIIDSADINLENQLMAFVPDYWSIDKNPLNLL